MVNNVFFGNAAKKNHNRTRQKVLSTLAFMCVIGVGMFSQDVKTLRALSQARERLTPVRFIRSNPQIEERLTEVKNSLESFDGNSAFIIKTPYTSLSELNALMSEILHRWEEIESLEQQLKENQKNADTISVFLQRKSLTIQRYLFFNVFRPPFYKNKGLIEVLDETLDIDTSVKVYRDVKQAMAYVKIGILYAELGNTQKALCYFKRAEEFIHKHRYIEKKVNFVFEESVEKLEQLSEWGKGGKDLNWWLELETFIRTVVGNKPPTIVEMFDKNVTKYRSRVIIDSLLLSLPLNPFYVLITGTFLVGVNEFGGG